MLLLRQKIHCYNRTQLISIQIEIIISRKQGTKILGGKNRQTISLLFCEYCTSLSVLINVLICLVLCELLEDFEVVGECFSGATGILDGYRNIPTSSKRECHGHSMVIICVYRSDSQFLRWSNHTVVRAFFNGCS